VIEVLNKADLLGGLEAVGEAPPGAVAISALTGEGLEALRAALDVRLAAGFETLDVSLPPSDGARIAWLYEHGEVLTRADAEDSVRLTVRLSPAARARFEQGGQGA
jgi:GTP-binding protein HflX